MNNFLPFLLLRLLHTVPILKMFNRIRLEVTSQGRQRSQGRQISQGHQRSQDLQISQEDLQISQEDLQISQDIIFNKNKKNLIQ